MLLKIGRICNSQCKCNYLRNQKLFLGFLFHFWNLHEFLDIFIKRMMVIPNVFPKLQTWKSFVRPFCKKCHFGTLFDSQHVKVSQKLAKSPWDHFLHVFSSFWERLIWKISPPLFREILVVSLNTLTSNAKYPVEDWQNLQFPMQMQLSEKRKTFSELFVPFLESTSNFTHFHKKDDGHT